MGSNIVSSQIARLPVESSARNPNKKKWQGGNLKLWEAFCNDYILGANNRCENYFLYNQLHSSPLKGYWLRQQWWWIAAKTAAGGPRRSQHQLLISGDEQQRENRLSLFSAPCLRRVRKTGIHSKWSCILTRGGFRQVCLLLRISLLNLIIRRAATAIHPDG